MKLNFFNLRKKIGTWHKPLVVKNLYFSLLLHYYRIFKGRRTFIFRMKKYLYFYHYYNLTMLCERCVEIPIIWEIVKQHQGKTILEVGNVLSHYFPIKHEVVDKYETAAGVINTDVVVFKPKEKYNLIVSISTLEHIGWDETPRDPQKVLIAIKKLKSFLAPGGQIVVTIPLGYNPYFDQIIYGDGFGFCSKYFFQRQSSDNVWQEVTLNNLEGVKYGSPFPGANGLFIGFYNKAGKNK